MMDTVLERGFKLVALVGLALTMAASCKQRSFNGNDSEAQQVGNASDAKPVAENSLVYCKVPQSAGAEHFVRFPDGAVPVVFQVTSVEAAQTLRLVWRKELLDQLSKGGDSAGIELEPGVQGLPGETVAWFYQTKMIGYVESKYLVQDSCGNGGWCKLNTPIKGQKTDAITGVPVLNDVGREIGLAGRYLAQNETLTELVGLRAAPTGSKQLTGKVAVELDGIISAESCIIDPNVPGAFKGNTAAAAQSQTRKCKVTDPDGYTFLRTPGIDKLNPVAAIKKGEELQIEGASANKRIPVKVSAWISKAKTTCTTGTCKDKTVKVNDNAPSELPKGGTKGTNLRRTPNVNNSNDGSNLVGVVANGATVSVVEEGEGNWIRVEFQSTVGDGKCK